MVLNASQIKNKIDRLRELNRERDAKWQNLRLVRDGKSHMVFEDLLSDEWPEPITANTIDTIARDLAESAAPMPSITCSSGTMVTDRAKVQADKRSKIANHYVQHSKLSIQHLDGADHYFSYGFEVAYIEPDFTDLNNPIPRVTIESPIGGYPEFDRWGRCRAYTRVLEAPRDVLANKFPEYFARILKGNTKPGQQPTSHATIARYCDADQISLILLEGDPLVLATTKNPLGEVPIVLARRPHGGSHTKGQFDDVLWVQAAREVMARLKLEAVQEAVRAPIARPRDASELSFGPGSQIITDSPEKVRRIDLNVPAAAFTEDALLQDEVRRGARYPQSREGNIDQSIATGQGINALLAGYNTQLRAAQTVFTEFFTEVIRLCFKMDSLYWPNAKKKIRGKMSGSPFELEYVSGRDIDEDYTCDVTYGAMAGLDPNRALILMLQMRADDALSRDTMMRNSSIEIDVVSEQQKVMTEKLRDSAAVGLSAYLQGIPQLIANGQDPAALMRATAEIIKRVEKGDSIEIAIAKAFEQPPTPPEVAPTPEENPLLPSAPPGMGGPSGAPAGEPDLSMMLAGISPSGNPQLGGAVMRRREV